MTRRKQVLKELIDRLNSTLQSVVAVPAFDHVRFRRDTLPSGDGYKTWSENELHPTGKGFHQGTQKFAHVLAALP